MALTREFKETVARQIKDDPDFAEALFCEAVQELLTGDFEVGKSLLRDFINATLGFIALGEALGVSSKSLMRMFGPKGNPASSNLAAVIQHLQANSGISLRVKPE